MAVSRSVSENVQLTHSRVRVTLEWDWEEKDQGILTICPDDAAPINAPKIIVQAGEVEELARAILMLGHVISLDSDELQAAVDAR